MSSQGTLNPNNFLEIVFYMAGRLEKMEEVIQLQFAHPFTFGDKTRVTNETLCKDFKDLDVLLSRFEARVDGRDELISFDSPLCSMEELPIRVTNMLVRLGQLEARVNALPVHVIVY